jgi:hypothetical protein
MSECQHDYGGVASMPGFAESLRLLVESERYSLTDIGMMFGVSRERMRQLCEKLNVSRTSGSAVGLMQYREWNDSLHRFIPRSRGAFKADRRRRGVVARRAERRLRLEAFRQSVVEAVTRLRGELGRDPGWRDILDAIDPAHRYNRSAPMPIIISLWQPNSNRNSREVAQEIRDATGLGRLPRGARSHRTSRSPRTEGET